MKLWAQTWWAIPLLLMLIYLIALTPLMGRKKGYTVDATPSYHLTHAIVSHGDLFPDVSVKQGYLYSLIYLPFYGLGTVVAFATDGDVEWTQRKAMCWMNTVITATQLGVTALILRRLRFSLTAQAWVPLIYGFSTMALAYARYDYNKCLAGLFLLLVMHALLRYRDGLRAAAPQCGAMIALLILVRAELGLIALPCLAAIFYMANPPYRRRDALFCAGPIALGVVLFLAYNWAYWEGELAGGYEGGFVLNPLPGLLGFLFAPGKSLFLFNPILILLPLLFHRFYRERLNTFFVWLALLVPPFGLYCFWGNWWGGWGWGPRHLVPLIPLMVLPLAFIVDRGQRAEKALLSALALLGFWIQWVGTCVDFNDVLLMLDNAGVAEQETIWTPVYSPLVHHFRVWFSVPLSRWDYGWVQLARLLPPAVWLAWLLLWLSALTWLAAALRHVVQRQVDYNKSD